MDKLFHIFVSSTYSDLQEERSRVSEAVSKAGHVPEGMEIFPASSQKQFDFIKHVIDRCDYYVVILGGRYGSMASKNIGFTELEYEYAISKKIPTLAFLHQHPDKIEQSKCELDPAMIAKLAAFRKRLEESSLVDYWVAPDQLATKVVAAIAQEVSNNPGVGWIRGNRAASEDLLNEINNLRKENEQLRSATPKINVSNLAGLDETFVIHYRYRRSYNEPERSSEISLSWREILKIIGPEFRTLTNTSGIQSALSQYMRDVLGRANQDRTFSMTDKERILNQMELLGFLKSGVYPLKGGGQGLFYLLTPSGLAEVLRLNAVVTGAIPSARS
jgi:hypothetical protein